MGSGGGGVVAFVENHCVVPGAIALFAFKAGDEAKVSSLRRPALFHSSDEVRDEARRLAAVYHAMIV